MPKLTDQDLAKLRTENPGVELHHLVVDEWDTEIVTKVPTRPVWLKFMEGQAEATTRYSSLGDLVMDCVVYPSREELGEIFKARPALMEEFALEVRKSAGAVKSVRRKKL